MTVTRPGATWCRPSASRGLPAVGDDVPHRAQRAAEEPGQRFAGAQGGDDRGARGSAALKPPAWQLAIRPMHRTMSGSAAGRLAIRPGANQSRPKSKGWSARGSRRRPRGERAAGAEGQEPRPRARPRRRRGRAGSTGARCRRCADGPGGRGFSLRGAAAGAKVAGTMLIIRSSNAGALAGPGARGHARGQAHPRHPTATTGRR